MPINKSQSPGMIIVLWLKCPAQNVIKAQEDTN